MPKIYIQGIGGLGNCLFQLVSAIYYCEKYNYTLILQYTEPLLFGTSNKFDKIKCAIDVDNNWITYNKTIYKNLQFTHTIDNHIIVYNDYTDTKILPNCIDNILVCGYNQNINLYKEYISIIPKYLNLYDNEIIQYITNKYGNISNGICIGIRIGNDFTNMNKLTSTSYIKAIDYFKDNHIDISNIYIISDTPNINTKFNIDKYYKYTEINESDIVQFYFGLMCKHYILSESTFHLWIAYLGTIDNKDKQVICFNNTDITNRKLEFDHWNKLDY
jgi:hypothetical protein